MLPILPPRESYERSPSLLTVAVVFILLMIAVAVMAFAFGPHPVIMSTYSCPVPDADGNLPSSAPASCQP